MAAVAALAAGCGGVQRLSIPPPPPLTTVPAAAPVTLPDLTGVHQQPVYGQASAAPVAVGPGQATINGTVLGPSGPLAGATVEADRFVGDRVASTEATTAADGSFTLSGILGGRWRVRAWQAPSLDLTTPQIFFLGGTETHTVTLTLTSFGNTVISSAINPSPPVAGQRANLVVQVDNPEVNAAGVLTYAPVSGAAVTLVGGSEWLLWSPNPTVTDANGVALFQVQCDPAGVPGLAASVAGVATQSLDLPGCAVPSAVPPPATSTTVPPPTTTTTVPSGSTTAPSVTATTRSSRRG